MKRPSIQIALGAVLGAGLAIILGAGGFWLAVGIAIGVALGFTLSHKSNKLGARS